MKIRYERTGKRTEMGEEVNQFCDGCGERLLSHCESVSIGSMDQIRELRARRCRCSNNPCSHRQGERRCVVKGQDQTLVLVKRFRAGEHQGAVERAGYLRRFVRRRTIHALEKRGACSSIVKSREVNVATINGVDYVLGHTGIDELGVPERAAWIVTLHGSTPLPRDIKDRADRVRPFGGDV